MLSLLGVLRPLLPTTHNIRAATRITRTSPVHPLGKPPCRILNGQSMLPTVFLSAVVAALVRRIHLQKHDCECACLKWLE
jgi:hypothetical protein